LTAGTPNFSTLPLPTLKAALLAHQAAHSAPATNDSDLACTGEAA
jgi:hypothetical protein